MDTALHHIKELEVQSAMLFQLAHDLDNKAKALRRELTKRGTSVCSPSQEDEEFQKKFEKVLYKRRKYMTRASVNKQKS